MHLDLLEIVLISTNLIMGICFAILFAKKIQTLFRLKKNSFIKLIIAFLFLYLFECISISAGMLTPFFSILFAIIVALIFGKKIREKPKELVYKSTKYLIIYINIPAVLLLLIPLVFLFTNAKDIFSTSEAFNFGIPDFVPFPANTILGFFLGVSITYIVTNSFIIAGIVRYMKKKYDSKENEIQI